MTNSNKITFLVTKVLVDEWWEMSAGGGVK